MSENTPQNTPEDNPGQENPGTAQAAESPALDGYGNDTGFAQAAEETDDAQDAQDADAPQ
ncbi:hypothetical protein AB2L27_15325 [Kineococcus sp. LSe6-4]|uniref:Nucleotide exchange factor GrpE n=1 Tax=Kineococcus halophytocola TaxID=3234027 RepID=A0ABV4H4W1_9ACTN